MVRTDDPNNTHVQLSVSANLDLQLDSTPRRLWYGKLNGPNPETRSCTLQGSRIEELQIKQIKLNENAPQKAFSWALNDRRDSGEALSLDVTFYPDEAVPGRFLHELIIETNLVDTPELVISLAGELTGYLYSAPSSVLFGNYETGVSMQKTVTIQTYQEIPFTIIAVDSADPTISVTIDNDLKALEHVITVRYEPVDEQSDLLQTQVKIVTDLEKQSELLLDIHGFPRRSQKKLPPRVSE